MNLLRIKWLKQEVYSHMNDILTGKVFDVSNMDPITGKDIRIIDASINSISKNMELII